MTLPASSATFVGRDSELGDIARLLSDPACRLLTLVGPGGIGKTRLALEAARPFSSAQFIPLQPLTSPDFIVSAIADGVGFQFYSGADPKQQLLDFLREKSWLLVLDNFEHLLDGATLLSEILSAAPDIRLLVTSRERLNLIEEWTLDVGALEQDSAVELFAQQARRVKASFTLTEMNRAAVNRICRLVGGMPLALELAASWVRALSCEAIADEIERSLDILETPARNVELRHRTMRAAFEPTWARLTDHEREVFMRLSVFRGGFTREAAKEVAGASLRTLSALVDKSLLKVDVSGRYDLHELLRQYAAEKLVETGEDDTTAECHLDYFLRFAQQVDMHNFGREQIAWYDRAETEMDNLRAAFARSVETEAGLRLAATLGWLFSERGYWIEGLDWLERALAANPDAPAALRAQALYSTAPFAGRRRDYEKVRTRTEEALTLARSAGDRWNTAWALSHLASYYYLFKDYEVERAESLLDESLTLFRALDDAMGITHNLIRRFWIADIQGDYGYALALVEEALRRASEAGDLIIEGWANQSFGLIRLRYHDLERARTYLERCLTLWRDAHYRIMLDTLYLSALVEQESGNTERAAMLCREMLFHIREKGVDNIRIDRGTMIILASIARTRGQFDRAVRLVGAANIDDLAKLAENITELSPLIDGIVEVRAQLGESAYAEAWTAGNAMTAKEAIAYALEGIPVSDEQTSVEAISQMLNEPLTVREQDILRLIADGLSNSEIADQLILAKSTIKWYIRQLFSKLDVTSRTQAVARGRSIGLLS